MSGSPGLSGTARPVIAAQKSAEGKARVRELTRCTKSVSLTHLVTELSRYLVGWRGYFWFLRDPFGATQHRPVDKAGRLRAVVWRQWKRGRTRFAALLDRSDKPSFTPSRPLVHLSSFLCNSQ